jgi:hypothetical protein
MSRNTLFNEQAIGRCSGCCHPETAIITKEGIKKIKNINTNDYVLTHNSNFKRVLNVSERNIDEEIIKIKNNFGDNIMLTKEHTILSKKYAAKTKLTQLRDKMG